MDAGAITLDALLAAEPARTPQLLERQESFAASLGRAFQSKGPQPAQTQARQAAEQLVAAALVAPLLEQLRNSSQAAPPFAPTQGEKQFRALADNKVAHDIVRASNMPIVERLTSKLVQRATPMNHADLTAAGVGP